MLPVAIRGRAGWFAALAAGAILASAFVVWSVLTPPDYRAAAAQGRTELARGHPVEALRAVSDVRRPGLGAAEALLVAAQAFLRLGRRDDAGRALERALVYDPESAEVARTLAPFRIMNGDTLGALDLLQRAARLEPNDVRAWRAMGMLHFTRMEYPESLAAYRAAVQRDPKDHDARTGLIKGLLNDNLDDEAEPLVASALLDEPDDPVVLGLAARLAQKTGQEAEATALADRVLAGQPDNLNALMARAGAALLGNRVEDARADAEHATRVDPNDVGALHLLSQCQFRLGLVEQGQATAARREVVREQRVAISELGKLIAQRPKDPALHCLMGRTAIEMGILPLAAESYRAALALDPRSRDAAAGLASLRALTAAGSPGKSPGPGRPAPSPAPAR